MIRPLDEPKFRGVLGSNIGEQFPSIGIKFRWNCVTLSINSTHFLSKPHKLNAQNKKKKKAINTKIQSGQYFTLKMKNTDAATNNINIIPSRDRMLAGGDSNLDDNRK